MTGIKGRKPPITGANNGWYAPDDIDIGSILYVDANRLIRGLTPGATGKVIKSNGLTPSIPSYQDDADSGGGGGGGGLVLLEQHAASSSPSLDFTAWYSTTYDHYVLELLNLVPVTNGAAVLFRVSTNGGSSYVSAGGSYSWGGSFWVNNASAAQGSNSDTSITLCYSVSNTASLAGASGSVKILSPGDTAAQMQMRSQCHGASTTNSGKIGIQTYGGSYLANTAVDALQVLMSTGNIASGIGRLYGIEK